MEDLLKTIIQQLLIQNQNLDRIADALERMTNPDPTRPKFVRPLSDFSNFNWDSIGAKVESQDRYGPGLISYKGQMYARRSRAEYGNDIWYSRSIGKDETGRNLFEVLIKFTEPPKVRSLPNDITDVLLN